MLGKHKIDMVVFEDVRNHAGIYAAHVYGVLWRFSRAFARRSEFRTAGLG
jgi:hypothetical protein